MSKETRIQRLTEVVDMIEDGLNSVLTAKTNIVNDLTLDPKQRMLLLDENEYIRKQFLIRLENARDLVKRELEISSLD